MQTQPRQTLTASNSKASLVNPPDPEVSTGDKLLDAAESLFAERGFHQASLRAITTAAGANIAAVNYHFGSKTGLVTQLLERRGIPLSEHRNQLLAEAIEEAKPGAPSVRAILTAFVRPVISLQVEHPHFPALIARLELEGLQPVVGEVFQRIFRDNIQRFVGALTLSCPDIPPEVLSCRLLFTVGAFHFVMCREGNISFLQAAENHGGLEALLLDYCEAGLRAPHNPSINPVSSANPMSQEGEES